MQEQKLPAQYDYTLIYNGFTDQALWVEFDKLEKKDRTVETMVNKAISRDLPDKMQRYIQAQVTQPIMK